MMKKVAKYWWLVILLLVATSLSFLDRQVLSITIIEIKKDLDISDVDYGFINAGFLASYAIMFTLGGILIDRYGSRRGLAFSVGFWSFSTVLHGLSNSVLQFTFFRFLLGLGEGGCFPGAIKAVIEWVPKDKHALANGIAIGGAAFGAVLAPPLCGYLLGFWDWRMIFVLTGSIGFLWLIGWLIITGKTDKQKTVITLNSDKSLNKYDFKSILTSREAIIFMAMRFVLDPILYFYMFWTPKYLNDYHHMDVSLIGKLLWIPFFALGIANIAGGWTSDWIFRRTNSLRQSRLIVMGGAALMTLPVALIGLMDGYVIILVFLVLAFLAHGLWITNYITSISDIFGSTATSTVVGLSGTAGAISSLVLNPIIGYIITEHSYNPLWIYSGIMYPIVFIGFIGLMTQYKVKLSMA